MIPVESILARLTALHPADRSFARPDVAHPGCARSSERRPPPTIHVAGTNGKWLHHRLHAGRAGSGGSEGARLHLASPGALQRALPDRRRRRGACSHRTWSSPPTSVSAPTPAPHNLVRDHHRRRARPVRAPCRRCPAARGRPGRPARCHQRGGLAAGERDHAGLVRSCRASRRHARRDRGGEGRHPRARRRRSWRRSRARPWPRSSARRRASEALIQIAGEHWTATEERGRLVYQDDAGLLDLPAPRLYGRHQFENAGVAIATLRAVERLEVPPSAFESGIARADWPARMQRLSHGPLAALAPAGGELRSTAGTTRTAGAPSPMRSPTSRSGCRGHWCWWSGCWRPRIAAASWRNFTGLVRRVVAVPIPGQASSLPVETVCEVARDAGILAQPSIDVAAALATVAQFALDPPPRILITGSLYLAGDVLARNGTPPI